MTSATTMFSVRAPARALREIRPIVFWPPAIILVASVVASLVDFDSFLAVARSAHEWILDQFGLLFSLSAFTAVVAIIVLAISPIGGVRIGGQGAKPLLTRWNWFAITLCTTIAT
ncbi:MAG: BCCT family transporter, partial [Pseudomonadota bacterium]